MAGLGMKDQPKGDQDCTKGRFAGQVWWIVLQNHHADLAGVQVAIVTGGAGGIGGMIVQRFLNDGASVAILDLNEENGNKKLAEFQLLGYESKVK